MKWENIIKQTDWEDTKFINKGRELLDVDLEERFPATGKFEHECLIWLEKYNDVKNRIYMESKENYEGKRTGRKMNPVIKELKDKINRKYHDALKARKEHRQKEFDRKYK